MNYLLWISAAVLLVVLPGSLSQQAKAIPTGEDLCKHSFHSYLCNAPKTSGRRRVYDGKMPSKTGPTAPPLTGANSFPQGTRLLPDKPKVLEQPNLIPDTSNIFQAEAYLPPKGVKPPTPDRFFGDSNLNSLSLLPPTPPPTRPTSPPTRPTPPPTRPTPPPTRYTPPPTRPTPPPTRPTPPPTRPTPPPTRPTPPPIRETTQPPLRFDANQNSGVQVLPDKKKHDGCGHSFHSYLCEPKKASGPRRTYNGQRPANVPQSNIIGANSFLQTERVLPPTPPKAPYLPPAKPQTPVPTPKPYVRPEPTKTYSQGSLLLGENSFLQPAKSAPPAPYLPPPAPYLPPAKPRLEPEIQPAAAQNPSVRLRPDATEKSEGCKHAFHSFLCDAPKGGSKRRRIYNGQKASPSAPNPNLVGQNSFPQPSKILPPQQITTTRAPFFADSSSLLSANLKPNANTYLPPPAPTPTYLPPKVQQKPQPNYFGDNSFLDPARLPPPTTPRPTTPRPTTPRPTTPRPTTSRPTTARTTTPRPTTPRTPPPQELRPAAAQSPSVQVRPAPQEKSDACHGHGHSFHSFLCDKPSSGGRRRIHTGRKPEITPINTNFLGENSFPQPAKLLPPPPPTPKPTLGPVLIGENSFLQGTQLRPNANTYLPPPPPTSNYLPPVPKKDPQTNINLFGDDSFLDPTQVRLPTQKPTPPPVRTTPRPPPPPIRTNPPPVRTTPRPPPPPIRTNPPPVRTTPRPPPSPTTTRRPAPPPTTTYRPRPQSSEATEEIGTHAFHSYLYQKPKSGGRRAYTGQRPSNLVGASSNIQPVRLLPPQPRRVVRQVAAAAAGEHEHHHDDHHGDHHGAHGAHDDHHHGDHHHHHHNITLEQLCRDPFHAFLCDPVDTSRRQLYDGLPYTPDKRGRSKGNLYGASSILKTNRIRPEPNSLVGGFINHKENSVLNAQILDKAQPLVQNIPKPSPSKTTSRPIYVPDEPNTSQNFAPINPIENVYTRQPIPVRSSPTPISVPTVNITPVVQTYNNAPRQPAPVRSSPAPVKINPISPPDNSAPLLDLNSLQNIRSALLAERVAVPVKSARPQSITEIISDTEPRNSGAEIVLQPIEINLPQQLRAPSPFVAQEVARERTYVRKPKVKETNQGSQNRQEYNADSQPRQRPVRRRRPNPRPVVQEYNTPVETQGRFDERDTTTHVPIHRNRYFDSLHTWQDGPAQRNFGEKIRQRRLPEGESSLPDVSSAVPISPAVFARGPREISASNLTPDTKCTYTFFGYQCSGGVRTKREEPRVFTGQGRATEPEETKPEAVNRDEKLHVQKIQRRVKHPMVKEEKVVVTEKSAEKKAKMEEKRVFTGQGRLPVPEDEEEEAEKVNKEEVTTTEDPQVVYQRGIEEEQKRRDDELKGREEEQKRRDEEQKRRVEEQKRRSEATKELEKDGTTEDPHVAYQKGIEEELKRREAEVKLREDEQKRREVEEKRREEEAERRKVQEKEVEEELERRKIQQKLVDEELERRKEERVRAMMEEERRQKIKELEDD